MSVPKIETKNIVGKALTVLGPVEAEDLGVTLCHEHILMDGSGIFIQPVAASDRAKAYQPINSDMPLEYLGWINYNWSSNLDNLRLLDERVALDEVSLYKQAGGDTIVEVTPIGVGRDPQGLARIARATGINIIMGTSYYVTALHPPEVETMTEDEIFEKFVSDITEGIHDVTMGGGVTRIGETKVCAGIIGEIGCTWPWGKNEKKVLRAGARAQRRTGAPLSIHPGRSEEAILEAIEFLGESGADLSRTIISHIERTVVRFETRRKVCEAGCYLGYDEFSIETNYPLSDIDLPNDYYRINQIIELVSNGYVKHVLLSHDICWKTRWVRYGGLGYGHILNNIVPRMRRKGISEDHIHTMLVENPKRVLVLARQGG
jgi:phosphotriesterase-related protein